MERMSQRDRRISWSKMDIAFTGLMQRKCIITLNEELRARLRQFVESEMRSCSMDLAGITQEYVQQ